MLDEHIVRDVEVADGSAIYKARYFVEAGIVHANIDGRIISLAAGSDTDEAVRRLLLGHIQTRTWKQRMAAKWGHPQGAAG